MARLYARPLVTPFVVLFIERDGSTYLISLLQSHPSVRTLFERFAVLRQQGATAEAQLSWARSYLRPPLIGRHAAIGFKTKLVDVLDPDGFAALVQSEGIKVIHMRRRNLVKAVISRINARRLYEATGNWNLYRSADQMPAMPIDPAEFDLFLREREEADQSLAAYVRGLAVPALPVEYESLLSDRDGVMSEVSAFLNIRVAAVTAKTLKNTRDDLREVVENFDALRARYAGTPYFQMFDEVLLPSGVAP